MPDNKPSMPRPARPGPNALLEELHGQLRDAIEKIESGEQWRAWLDFARRLHRYSFNNVILIWAQCPTASAVASYTSWKAMGRQVRRGESAIRVMAPIIRRADIADETGPPKLGDDGRKQRRQQVLGFRPAPVFDVGQTDGPPLPGPPQTKLLTGKSPAGLWDAMVTEINERGYRLMRGPASDLAGANGVTRVKEREVWVRDDVDDAQAVKTLVHELAHVLLHANEGDGTAPCRGVMEVEAESVAHLVMAAHNFDTGAYTFPYVATWAHPLAAVEHVPMADIVTRTGDRVMKAAREILEVTHAAVEASRDHGLDALARRVDISARRTAELRDQVSAATLPAVDRATLLGVVADSHSYFQRQLPQSWVPSYLAERILHSAAASHQVGYAPKGWTDLTDHLRGLGYTDDHIEAAGVATRARDGHLIDRFRDRMIIPLRDYQGQLVAFTGRIAPDGAEGRAGPKYLNSPTTAIFRKSQVLYGLGESLGSIRDGRLPVLCEGPLDAIAIDLLAAERNLPMVGVAASGTALTSTHADQILAAVEDRLVCLAFDGDHAGRVAAESAWRRLTDAGPREVAIADLPTGTDPASLYADEPEVLARLIRASQPAATVIADWQISDARLEGNIHRELDAFRALVAFSGRMPMEQRPAFVLSLANRLHIDAAEAATEAVERNPKLLMDRAVDRCDQLSKTMAVQNEGRGTMALDRQLSEPDHAHGRTQVLT